jgi:eukaryotic-like serine/threonine-protein kinase
MTPAQLQTIEEIFYAALEQDSDDVARFLETTCEGDELLRGEVEGLLASRQRVGSFIETPAVGIATRIIRNGQADLLVGQTFGHYKISKRIGSGGMGEVYLASDMTAGRKAALKLLPMRFTGDAERLKRFQQEAHAVVALNHPNILTVYEIGEDHSTHYIASELIEGETLRQRLTRGRIEVGEAVDIAIQVASALDAAYEAGIVHRDINPGNIMLRPDGYVKVLDFGIAKLAESAFAKAAADGAGSMTLAETNLGSILGTVRYMSPEQASGGQVDKGTDLWSLGVVLYEMVTGHAPFIGDTPREVMTSILEKEPSPLTSYIRQTPPELQQIVSKTLRKDRTERYQIASEMLQPLKNLRHKLESKAELERSTTPLWLRWARSPIALMLLLLVSALALALPFYRHRNLPTSLPPEKSIAVLPFENLSKDEENAYFAGGVQDEILTNLAKVADLKVISRMSVMKYKSGPERNLREIAKTLGVSHVVEGSVQGAGGRVRISVQLVNALNDSHIWAETYDRKLIDVFQVESDVAQKIAASLEVKLTGREKRDIAVAGTKNPEAYDAFLRALALRNKQSVESLNDLIGFSRRAVELDPNYAEAWALLGIAEAQRYPFFDHSDAQLKRARTAAETALRLAPDMAHAHAAMGIFYYYCLQDFDRALTELKIAHERAPNDGIILFNIGLVKRRQGKFDESIEVQQQSAKLDPLNEDIWANLGRSYRGARRFDEARAMFDRALTIAPNDVETLSQKAETYLAQGDLDTTWSLISSLNLLFTNYGFHIQIDVLTYRRQFDEAIAQVSSALGSSSNTPPVFVAIGHAKLGNLYVAKGDHVKAKPLFVQAEQELKSLRAGGDNSFLPADILVLVEARLGHRDDVETEADSILQRIKKDAWGLAREEEAVARAYTSLGEFDRAVPLLQHALATPTNESLTPALLRLDPFWDPVRNDPRFQELCKDK